MDRILKILLEAAALAGLVGFLASGSCSASVKSCHDDDDDDCDRVTTGGAGDTIGTAAVFVLDDEGDVVYSETATYSFRNK